jgi:hypothetical protein
MGAAISGLILGFCLLIAFIILVFVALVALSDYYGLPRSRNCVNPIGLRISRALREVV